MSFPVSRYTTLVQLVGRQPPSNALSSSGYIQRKYLELASAATRNLIIMSAELTAFLLMDLGKLESYWPNLRTLSICNVYISPWTYSRGKGKAAREGLTVLCSGLSFFSITRYFSGFRFQTSKYTGGRHQYYMTLTISYPDLMVQRPIMKRNFQLLDFKIMLCTIRDLSKWFV